MEPELELVHRYNVSYRVLKTKGQEQFGLSRDGVRELFDRVMEADNFAWLFIEREDITSTGHLPK